MVQHPITRSRASAIVAAQPLQPHPGDTRMKYLQNGGFQSNPHMRLTLGLALVLLAAFWVSNGALYFAHMTLSPASVAAYYRGDEAAFMAPRSAESMLEVTHMHLPMFALVLLLLTHLLVFAPMHDRRKTLLIVASFGSALLMEAAGWLTRFGHPGFAWLKVGAFVMFECLLGGLIAGLALFLLRGQRAGRVTLPPRPRGRAPR